MRVTGNFIGRCCEGEATFIYGYLFPINILMIQLHNVTDLCQRLITLSLQLYLFPDVHEKQEKLEA
jgi:hypothetical protein